MLTRKKIILMIGIVVALVICFYTGLFGMSMY
jgi:hypothetical protein